MPRLLPLALPTAPKIGGKIESIGNTNLKNKSTHIKTGVIEINPLFVTL